MRDDCLILAVFVVGCVLFLQIGCQPRPFKGLGQEQAGVAEESKAVLAASKPAIAPVKAETEPDVNDVNEPAPKITLEEAVHDFGKIGPGTKNICEFKNNVLAIF